MAATNAIRNGDWSREERILALDLYLRHGGKPPGGKKNPELLALSALLREAAVRRGDPISETFRNGNGVWTKLMNFRQYDPAFYTEGKSGMTHSAKDDAEVWAEFASDPKLCAQTANAIRVRMEKI